MESTYLEYETKITELQQIIADIEYAVNQGEIINKERFYSILKARS